MVSFEISNSSELRCFISVFKSWYLSPNLYALRYDHSIPTIEMVSSINICFKVCIVIVSVKEICSTKIQDSFFKHLLSLCTSACHFYNFHSLVQRSIFSVFCNNLDDVTNFQNSFHNLNLLLFYFYFLVQRY